jgi:hypothetical protein
LQIFVLSYYIDLVGVIKKTIEKPYKSSVFDRSSFGKRSVI